MLRRCFKVKQVTINPQFDFYINDIRDLVDENIKDDNVKFEVEQNLQNIIDIAEFWNTQAQTAGEKFYIDPHGLKSQKIDDEFFFAITQVQKLMVLTPEEKFEQEWVAEEFKKNMAVIIRKYQQKQLREMTLVNELWHAGLYDYEKEEVIKDK